jgi:hypothetical protein
MVMLLTTLLTPLTSVASLVTRAFSAAFLAMPVIVTTGRNLQLLAEPQDGMLVFHRVDPFIPFEDGSERMPNVFFKMMTCSRV